MSKLTDDIQAAIKSGITYSIGMNGPAVGALQAGLLQAGFSPQGVDNVFGPLTEAATKDFQRSYGIGQTGQMGNQTMTKLLSVLAVPQAQAHGSGHLARPKVDVDLRSSCPNHAYRNGVAIDTIVLHNTEGSLSSAEDRFEEPVDTGDQVSAHFIMSRDGRCVQMVDESLCAWHSGDRPTNQRSIGIESVAGGGTGTGLTDAQQTTLVAWVKYLMSTYNVTIDNVIPHRSVVSTSCPGSIWPTDADFAAWKKTHLS